VPVVQVHPASAKRLLEALVGPRDVAVERDRHVACGSGHAGWTAPRPQTHRRCRQDDTPAGGAAVLPAMMPDVEDVEVVVAHSERATLRVGEVFLKVDA
jgi:hypothetical protein